MTKSDRVLFADCGVRRHRKPLYVAENVTTHVYKTGMLLEKPVTVKQLKDIDGYANFIFDTQYIYITSFT